MKMVVFTSFFFMFTLTGWAQSDDSGAEPIQGGSEIAAREMVADDELAAARLPAAVGDGSVQRIKFERGGGSAVTEGSVTGYGHIDYILNVRAGQYLNISLATDNRSNYFNLIEPGETDVAVFIGSTSGNQFEGTAAKSGSYRIRVYLMRNAARREETANFRLETIVSGKGESAADSGTAARAAAVESPEYSQECKSGTPPPAAATAFFDKFLGLITAPPTGPGAEEATAPGAVILVTGPDWTYCGASGVTEAGGQMPIRYDMPFEAGSNTKMMTATVLLQLQEEGRLSLDDRLDQHLPEIAMRLTNGSQITLRQLANHTSGIFNYTDDAPDGTPGVIQGGVGDPALMMKRFTPMQLVEFAIEHGKPDFAPGSQGNWKYSNTGYVLLGMIIEQVTGKPLESVFEKRIFVPLEMAHTFFWSDVPRAAFGLPASYWSAPFEVDATTWNMSQAWAAGAVISTAPDLAKFVTALLNGRLFSNPATLETMKETIETGNAVIPRYGIGLASKAPGVWGHGGQTIGFQSDVGYLPDLGVSIVAWGNSGNNLAGVAAAVLADVVRAVATEQ